MARNHPKFDTDTFIYWLKLGLAIQYTKETIQPLIIEDAGKFQEEILKDVYCMKGVSRGTTCSSCRTENVIPCPTRDFCTKGNKAQCKLHAQVGNQKRPCPKNICDTFVNRIRDEHRYFKPSWKNCNAESWCAESIEIAKCFMPKDGYADVTCFDDVDFNGLLNVIINNKRLQAKFGDDLSNPTNIAIQTREVGKTFRHCPDLGIHVTLFMRCIDVLISFLSDLKCPFYQGKVKDAIIILNQLKNEKLNVTSTDAVRMIEEFYTSQGIQKLSAHGERLKTRMQEEKRIFLNSILNSAKSVDHLTAEVLQKIGILKDNVIDEIRNVGEKERQAVIKEGKTLKRQHAESIRKAAKRLKLTIKREQEKAVADVKRVASSNQKVERISESKDYSKLKESLQTDMIELCRKQHINVPVSPIREENRAFLLRNYVTPTLICKEYEKGPYINQTFSMSRRISSYRDIFYNGSIEYKDIYLSAPAGSGKTSFVKRMTLAWCHSKNPIKEHEIYFTDEEIITMKSFEFVFLLSIREISQEQCDVDEMIREQVLSQLSLEYLFDNNLLQEILHTEKCLIVIDGLDEWTNENGQTMTMLPKRKIRPLCTILTTARPWKVAAIIESQNFIDQHIQLDGLEEQSANKLIENALIDLNEKYHESKSPDEFKSLLKQNRVHKLKSIPLMLLQLLCLWFADNKLGNSRCEIYSNMLEFLFNHAQKRRSHPKTRSKAIKTRKPREFNDLPKCFSNCHLCYQHHHILVALGKLAFHGLFCFRSGSSLLFNRSVVEKYLNPTMLSYCLEIGILSQNNAYRKLKHFESNYSFIHKTYQEYLAALYISLNMSRVSKEIFDFCNSTENILQVSNVFIFVSGMNEDVTIELWKKGQEIVSNDSDTTSYRKNIGTLFIKSRHKMKRWHTTMINCLHESYDNGFNRIPPIAQDVFINSKCKLGWILEKHLIDRNMHNIRSLDIQTDEIEEQVHEMFHSLDVQSLDSLENLYIWGSLPTQDIALAIQSSCTSLVCLELWHLTFTDVLLNALCQLDQLEGLSLLSVEMSHRHIERLMDFLSSVKNLRQVSLNELKCLDHRQFCDGYTLNLLKSSKLEMLCIDKLHVSEIKIEPQKLIMCVADWVHKGGALASLLDIVKHAPNLERFECDGVEDEKDLDKLVEVLTCLETLKFVKLRNIKLEERKLCFDGCVSLEFIYMWHVEVNVSSIENLIDKIKDEHRMVTVMIEDCKIEPAADFEKLKQLINESNEIDVIRNTDVRNKNFEFHFKIRR